MIKWEFCLATEKVNKFTINDFVMFMNVCLLEKHQKELFICYLYAIYSFVKSFVEIWPCDLVGLAKSWKQAQLEQMRSAHRNTIKIWSNTLFWCVGSVGWVGHFSSSVIQFMIFGVIAEKSMYFDIWRGTFQNIAKIWWNEYLLKVW